MWHALLYRKAGWIERYNCVYVCKCSSYHRVDTSISLHGGTQLNWITWHLNGRATMEPKFRLSWKGRILATLPCCFWISPNKLLFPSIMHGLRSRLFRVMERHSVCLSSELNFHQNCWARVTRLHRAASCASQVWVAVTKQGMGMFYFVFWFMLHEHFLSLFLLYWK